MKEIIIVLLCIVLSLNQGVNGQAAMKGQKRIIVIDAGHGGIDSGAISKGGIQEKDIVLDIARSMVQWNRELFAYKYDIFLTRNADTLISLKDRVKLAKYLNPDIFISLHCNHNDDSSVTGIELYTYDANVFSLMYAESISDGLNQNLGFKVREVKQANFQVLRESVQYCPSILLELGYLSNTVESGYLKNREKRKALALAILMSI